MLGKERFFATAWARHLLRARDPKRAAAVIEPWTGSGAASDQLAWALLATAWRMDGDARYDWLDLNSGAIIGGRQQTMGASVIWMPTDYVRYIANYDHLWLNDAAVAAAGSRDYQAVAFGVRAQFDF